MSFLADIPQKAVDHRVVFLRITCNLAQISSSHSYEIFDLPATAKLPRLCLARQ